MLPEMPSTLLLPPAPSLSPSFPLLLVGRYASSEPTAEELCKAAKSVCPRFKTNNKLL